MTTAPADIKRPVPRSKPTSGGRRPAWTAHEEALLRTTYDGSWQSLERVAIAIDRTFIAVKSKASYLGLTKPKPARWTPEEDAKLEEWGQQHAPVWIAQRLPGRSAVAVSIRLKRLRIHRRYRDGWYSQHEVCELLGIDHHQVQAAVRRGELRATRQNVDLPGALWRIEVADLRRYVLEHLGEFTGRNVDLVALVELLGVRR